MKRKSRVYSVAALLLALAMVSTVMISGTFAKYTTAVAGQDTALVARWSFDAFGGQDGATPLGEPGTPADLDLFQHEYEQFVNNNDGEADAKYILAPGVNGEFVVKVDYIADVAADVEIAIDPLAGNAPVPIEYSVDNGATWVKLDSLAEALADNIVADAAITEATASDPDTAGVFRIAATEADSTDAIEITKTVQWRWAYDATAQTGNITGVDASSDTVDTDLGEASQAAAENDITLRTKYGIKISLTATQVTPGTL